MPDVREKLVKLLGNLFCGDYGINGCDSCKYNTEVMCSAHACADHLIANGVTIQRWIPVTERLPEPFEVVLVYDSIDKCGSLAYMTIHQEWVGIMMKRGVTYWMPLPQQPKEE